MNRLTDFYNEGNKINSDLDVDFSDFYGVHGSNIFKSPENVPWPFDCPRCGTKIARAKRYHDRTYYNPDTSIHYCISKCKDCGKDIHHPTPERDCPFAIDVDSHHLHDCSYYER